MSCPLVTIISPTYNQEGHVACCAESALAQTYQDWEQIFVDDGSTDGTRDVLASFKDPRIRVISLPHAGLASLERSYNTALAASRGSLVAILEGDDAWPPDKLAIQLSSFREPDTFLSWGRADLIDERGANAGELVRVHTDGERVRIRAREAFHRLTRSNFLTPTVTVMIRREALERVGGFRQTGSSLLVDLPTWLWTTAVEDGYVEFVNRRLGKYRVYGAQTSQQKRAQMMSEHFAVVEAVERELGGEALARIGWDEAARSRARSRALLAAGEAALEEGRRSDARAAFLAAVQLGAGAADTALALAGVASSVVRLNLVRLAFAVRNRA